MSVESPIHFELPPNRTLLDRSHPGGDGNPGGDDGRDSPSSSIGTDLSEGPHYTIINCSGVTRLALMVTPTCGGDFQDQLWETISLIRGILKTQKESMALTVQTVFVADAHNVAAAEKLFQAYFGEKIPLTLFMVQPPCNGAALAVEAWAISSVAATVNYLGPHLVNVEHSGLRWVYASSGAIHLAGRSAYEQAEEAFAALNQVNHAVGVPFGSVVRIWLYQGGITEVEDGQERYRELNRGRTDFYSGVDFTANPLRRGGGDSAYPASTGIGTLEHGLVLTSLAVQSDREDVAVLPLENPRQVSAFDYPEQYSKKSPKFSRAMGIRIGDRLTTWVSGTASIVDAETVHIGDIVGQTNQTLDNIENLISCENYARQGWTDAGATLQDLAKVRVYVKHPEDYEACKEVCRRRLGDVPVIYAVAQVCRPDLLVEIECVAFSSLENTDQSS